MKSSRFYQNCVQTVGSFSEVILFLCGFYLGKEMLITALIFLVLRVTFKITVSELMYRRSLVVVKEGVQMKEEDECHTSKKNEDQNSNKR